MSTKCLSLHIVPILRKSFCKLCDHDLSRSDDSPLSSFLALLSFSFFLLSSFLFHRTTFKYLPLFFVLSYFLTFLSFFPFLFQLYSFFLPRSTCHFALSSLHFPLSSFLSQYSPHSPSPFPIELSNLLDIVFCPFFTM